MKLTKTIESMWIGDTPGNWAYGTTTAWNVVDDEGKVIKGGVASSGSNVRRGRVFFERRKDAQAWVDGRAFAKAHGFRAALDRAYKMQDERQQNAFALGAEEIQQRTSK